MTVHKVYLLYMPFKLLIFEEVSRFPRSVHYYCLKNITGMDNSSNTLHDPEVYMDSHIIHTQYFCLRLCIFFEICDSSPNVI